MPVEGIDVSKHQGKINWKSVTDDPEAAIKFVFCRASYGDERSYEARFAENWKGARSAGLIVGAYHYFLPRKNVADVDKQAALFLDQVKSAVAVDEIGYLPPVLDIEESLGAVNKSEYVAGIARWIELVEASDLFNGLHVIMYTSRAKWSGIGNPSGYSDRLLWVPDYSRDPPRLPAGWGDFAFFQYTEAGQVGKIKPCDRNRFNGTLSELKALTRKKDRRARRVAKAKRGAPRASG